MSVRAATVPAVGPVRRLRGAWLLAALVLLALAVLASLMVGSRPLPPEVVWDALLHPGRHGLPGAPEPQRVVLELRVPRTVLGVLVGAAFAVAGALIQAFTRNPLADPGVLGVNAGAAFAVTLGVAAFGVSTVAQFLPFAFAGAVLATVMVYLLASRGSAPTPLRLTLVGVALAAVLGGFSQTLALLDADTFDRVRFWGAGTIADRPPGTIAAVVGGIVVGLVLAWACAGPLNALALGDDVARGLGVRLGLLRGGCVLAVTLLCGSATAAAGPIAFVGLMVPHVVRWCTGPDQRWIIPFCVVLGPVLMLLADVLGRLVVWPAELQAGIVTAFVGAPVLIALVRRTRASGL